MWKILLSVLSSAIGGDTDFDIDHDYTHLSSAGELHFGQTVEFPDGTQVDDPNQDSQGYVYPSRRDYLDGTNPHIVDD